MVLEHNHSPGCIRSCLQSLDLVQPMRLREPPPTLRLPKWSDARPKVTDLTPMSSVTGNLPYFVVLLPAKFGLKSWAPKFFNWSIIGKVCCHFCTLVKRSDMAYREAARWTRGFRRHPGLDHSLLRWFPATKWVVFAILALRSATTALKGVATAFGQDQVSAAQLFLVA